MRGTKWVDKHDGRIVTFAMPAKYLSINSALAGADSQGKFSTYDVVTLVDDLTGAGLVVDVQLFFAQFKPLAIQPVSEDQAEDMPMIN